MVLDTKEMFDYVEHILIQNGGLKSKKKHLGFRNRLEHIKRVYGWAERILPGVENCNKDMVLTAAIFHDIGYTNKDNDEHAALGAELFLEYAKKHDMDEYFSSCVADLIRAHSNKDLLKLADTPKELIVLIEADLMDEEGALGLVFDLLAEGY
ncbi:MAG: HD domain-containing protein, partial [Anaeroplasmataceae bacterium]|nr:HD domain-containing protein [Anaeroplasmataceae bacterium]